MSFQTTAERKPVISTGPAEILYQDIDTTRFGYDMSASTIRINDHELFFCIQNGDGVFKKLRGTLDDPFRTLVWSGYKGRWEFPEGFPTEETERYRPWLAHIHKINDTEYLGFVHVETAFWDDWEHITFVQGIAYSADAGDHWYYCGDVVRAADQGVVEGKNRYVNMGGCPLIVVGDYFYQYYNDRYPGAPVVHGVARARVDDVIAAARQKTVCPWFKYYQGGWDEPGMNGRSDDILPKRDMHVDAVYCAPLKKYIMALYGKNEQAYVTSDDGLAWSEPVKVFTPEPDAQTPYPFFAGLEGASDDCGTVGKEFYMYFPDRVNFKVYRVPFSVGK